MEPDKSGRSAGGRFAKGLPSANPHGRYTATAKAKAAIPPGVTGAVSYGGWVGQQETARDLFGRQKWITYSNAMLRPVVGTGIRYFANLLAGTDWHAEENPEGGADAKRGVEIVTKGLLEAPMLKPWTQVVRKAAMFRPLGFSLHATAMRRRPDGMVVFAAIEHRPQFSIERWLRDNETQPFNAVVQRAPESQREITIPLEECFYLVDDTLTDSPDGTGLLRHIVEYIRRLGLFEEWEGKALSEDMAGTPLVDAPLAEIRAQAGTSDEAELAAAQTAALGAVTTFVGKRIKTPEQQTYWIKDSSVYANTDGTLVPGAKKWGLEIVKTETANLDRLDATIRRVELQIARVLGIEWTLMGADGKGSYSQHEDKTSMFATNLQTTLTEMGWAATMQLARRLVAANGLDPDKACPRLVAEPISTEAIETVTRSLANIALAGMPPNDPARNVLRKRMRLPPEPENPYDLGRASRLVPLAGDGAPPPGEAEVDPTAADGAAQGAEAKPGAAATDKPTEAKKLSLAELRKRVVKGANGWDVYAADGTHRAGGIATKKLAIATLEALEAP